MRELYYRQNLSEHYKLYQIMFNVSEHTSFLVMRMVGNHKPSKIPEIVNLEMRSLCDSGKMSK